MAIQLPHLGFLAMLHFIRTLEATGQSPRGHATCISDIIAQETTANEENRHLHVPSQYVSLLDHADLYLEQPHIPVSVWCMAAMPAVLHATEWNQGMAHSIQRLLWHYTLANGSTWEVRWRLTNYRLYCRLQNDNWHCFDGRGRDAVPYTYQHVYHHQQHQKQEMMWLDSQQISTTPTITTTTTTTTMPVVDSSFYTLLSSLMGVRPDPEVLHLALQQTTTRLHEDHDATVLLPPLFLQMLVDRLGTLGRDFDDESLACWYPPYIPATCTALDIQEWLLAVMARHQLQRRSTTSFYPTKPSATAVRGTAGTRMHYLVAVQEPWPRLEELYLVLAVTRHSALCPENGEYTRYGYTSQIEQLYPVQAIWTERQFTNLLTQSHFLLRVRVAR
jgi:hypothetical protein